MYPVASQKHTLYYKEHKAEVNENSAVKLEFKDAFDTMQCDMLAKSRL